MYNETASSSLTLQFFKDFFRHRHCSPILPILNSNFSICHIYYFQIFVGGLPLDLFPLVCHSITALTFVFSVFRIACLNHWSSGVKLKYFNELLYLKSE